MILAQLYLITFIFAPQLWWKPLLAFPVDYVLYPIWFVWSFFKAQIKRVTFGPQEGFLALWIFWVFVSIVVKGDVSSSKELIVYYVKCFLVVFFLIITLTTFESIRGVLKWLVFLSFIMGIEGIQHYQSENGIGWAGQTLGWVEDAAAKGRTRWVGIFDGPGVFCVVYTIALPFMIHYIFTAKNFFYKSLAVAASAVVLVAIYYNGSRGGFITTLCIIFGYVLYKTKSKAAIIYGSIIVGALLMVAPSYMTNLADSHHSSSKRVEMWAEGCDLLQANPVFGVGRGKFSEYSGSLIAHNSFVEIMAETGFVGLFFWTGMIYVNVKRLFAACTMENQNAQAFALPFMLSIIGYQISACFVTLELETLYFLVGFSAAFSNTINIPNRLDKNDLKRIFFVVVSFIICMKLFVTLIGPAAFR